MLLILDPTYNFFAIATPPAIVNEPPVVLFVESVTLLNVIVLLTVNVPVKELLPLTDKSDPIYNFFAIAAPPAIVNEPPVVLFVASILEIIFKLFVAKSA